MIIAHGEGDNYFHVTIHEAAAIFICIALYIDDKYAMISLLIITRTAERHNNSKT